MVQLSCFLKVLIVRFSFDPNRPFANMVSSNIAIVEKNAQTDLPEK